MQSLLQRDKHGVLPGGVHQATARLRTHFGRQVSEDGVWMPAAAGRWQSAQRRPRAGRGAVSFAARGSDMGETAEWQTTQAAQGAPWLCSQPEADCAPGAAHRSAAVSAACRSVPSEGRNGAAPPHRGRHARVVPLRPMRHAMGIRLHRTGKGRRGEVPWSMPGMLWCTAAVLAPMAGKVPMAMASPARPRRASRTTRERTACGACRNDTAHVGKFHGRGDRGGGQGRTAKMGRGAPACRVRQGGGPSAYLVRISLPSLVACRR
jgi:hypothetical protein